MGNKGTRYFENFVYPSGNTYTGEMKGKKRHGTGVYTWSEDGCIYDGDWYENQQNGQGTMTFKNGNRYIGEFVKNNIHGEGTLVTRNGETIKGYFQFKQRMMTVDGPRYPVGEYMLNVDVTSSNGSKQKYVGPATLHIYTGMLVLPGMAKPDQPIYDAIVVMDPVTENKSQFAVVDNVNAAANTIPVATATPVAANQIPTGIVVNQVPVVEAMPVQAAGAQTVTAEEGHVTGVAFGKQDEAYVREVKLKSRPVNVFDPRNYF
mmetsp:Transcript_4256/g.5651  ORF Transcript_4256/g.5651 Transcript_4256/m.5651 type:complete len:262 (+) Transcript_4256:301-1086(+)